MNIINPFRKEFFVKESFSIVEVLIKMHQSVIFDLKDMLSLYQTTYVFS